MKNNHVCFFLNSINFGGSEQYLYSIAEKLSDLGCKITFVSGGGRMEQTLKDKNYNIVNVPIFGIFKNTIDEHPWKHRLIFNNWSLVKVLYQKYLKQQLNGVTSIISQHGFPTMLASEYSKKNNTNLINIVHHVLPNEYTDLYNDFSVTPDVYVAISPEIKQFLQNDKNISNCTVISNPISLPLLDASNHQKSTMITLLSHVHLEKEQSLRAFLDVSNEIEVSKYSFTVVGDNTSDFANEIMDEYPKVKFTGALHRDEALKYVNESFIVVGVGRSAVESAILGKPTIICGHIKGKFGGNYGGLLTEDSFESISQYNFSGRHASSISTTELLLADIKLVINKGDEFEGVARNRFNSFSPDFVSNQFVKLIT